jgi:hypothetical protein
MNKYIENFYSLIKNNNEEIDIKMNILDSNENTTGEYSHSHEVHSGMSAIKDVIYQESGEEHIFSVYLYKKNIIFRFLFYFLSFILYPFSQQLKKYKWKRVYCPKDKTNKNIYGLLSKDNTDLIKKYCKENKISLYVYLVYHTNTFFKKEFLLNERQDVKLLLPVIFDSQDNFKFLSISLKNKDNYLSFFKRLKLNLFFEMFSIVDFEMFLLKWIPKKIKFIILNQKKERFSSFSYFGQAKHNMGYLCGSTPATNLCKLTSCSCIFNDRYAYGFSINYKIKNIIKDDEKFNEKFKEHLLKPLKK